MNKYVPVIGLEIHVELGTKSKMFCGCPADWFGKPPNTHACPVCLGMPGALPVPNKQAVEWTILLATALDCQINKHSKFDRKHYFYPDLPKGYQISQYDEPFGTNGKLQVTSNKKQIVDIRRVHLEEDTGKLIHQGEETLVDFNRSGVPLVEIVTEPVFDNSDDVKSFLEELQTIVRYLGISDADMEEGSMRLEPNISLSPQTTNNKRLPTYKVEIKNINSFRFAAKAIEYEIKRQEEILEKGEVPLQETRGWNEKHNKTVPQRSKEEAHDYRYFPEPDIPAMEFSDKELDAIKKQLPELPGQKAKRYIEELGLKPQDALTLTRDKKVAGFFEMVIMEMKRQPEAQIIANLIVNKKLSTNIAVEEFVKKAKEIMTPKTIDQSLLTKAIDKVISDNAEAVNSYKAGKETVLMFLVGQVMKDLKGQADAILIKKALEEKLL